MSKAKEMIKKLKYELHMYHGAEFETPLNIIEQALERLEAIESVDGGEAMKILQKLATIPLNIDAYRGTWTTLSTQDDYKKLENFILKSQQQERELEKKNELLELYRLKNYNMEDYYTYNSLRGSQQAFDNLKDVNEEINLKEKELEELK